MLFRLPDPRRPPANHPPHTAHKQQSRDHGVQEAARGGDPLELNSSAAAPRKVPRGEDGRQVVGRERTGLAAAAVAGRSAVAGVDAAAVVAHRGVDRAARGHARMADRGFRSIALVGKR